jgi:hypothetical protein
VLFLKKEANNKGKIQKVRENEYERLRNGGDKIIKYAQNFNETFNTFYYLI